MYVLAALSLVQTVLFVALVAYMWVQARRIKRLVTDFMVPQEEGKPSALAMTWEAACDMLARAVMARATTAVMTASSAVSRAARAVEGDIMEDMAREQSPVAGFVLDRFPTLSKTLKRNPALMDLAMSTLQKVMAGAQNKGGAGASTNGATSSITDLGRVTRR